MIPLFRGQLQQPAGGRGVVTDPLEAHVREHVDSPVRSHPDIANAGMQVGQQCFFRNHFVASESKPVEQ